MIYTNTVTLHSWGDIVNEIQTEVEISKEKLQELYDVHNELDWFVNAEVEGYEILVDIIARITNIGAQGIIYIDMDL